MSLCYIDLYSQLIAFSNLYKWSCPLCSFENITSNYPICAMCNQTTFELIENLILIRSSDTVEDCSSFVTQLNDDRIFYGNFYQATMVNKLNECNLKTEVSKSSRTTSTQQLTTVHKKQTPLKLEFDLRFQEIIANCREAKTNFIDDEFSPSYKIIGDVCSNEKNVSWLRISDIYGNDTKKNSKHSWDVILKPKASDIEQGALGNCWLLAALTIVTERPRLIEDIVRTKTKNNEGVYVICICHNGLWKNIIVDDYFPCINNSQLVFAKSKHQQFYVPLIEKACAKIFGSYANLTGGTTREGLQLFTGSPCDNITLQSSNQTYDNDIIWARLVSACEMNSLIGASTSRLEISDEEYHSVNIHRNHAFSILAVHTVVADDAYRCVLVRDPHSFSNYNDKNMKVNILEQLNMIKDTKNHEGSFWIDWSKFLRYFSSIVISNYNENDYDLRYEGRFTCSSTEHVSAYRFHLSETSFISISLIYQRSSRKTIHSHTQSFVLCDIDDEAFIMNSIGNYENILVSHQGPFTYWTGTLRPGNYVIVPFSISFWTQNSKQNNYTLVVQSRVSIKLNIKLEPATFLADCLISTVIKKYHKLTKEKDVNYYRTSDNVKFMLIIAENHSNKNYLNVNTNIIHPQYVYHSRHFSTTYDSIPPLHRQLIFITEWKEKDHPLRYIDCNTSYSHSNQPTITKPTINIHADDIHTPRIF